MRPNRSLAIAATIAASFIAMTSTAGAAPGNGSCKDFGAATAEAARTGALVPEIRSLTPGTVDDVVALAKVGGEFDGETVPSLCTSK
jgi:hypothetical protein